MFSLNVLLNKETISTECLELKFPDKLVFEDIVRVRLSDYVEDEKVKSEIVKHDITTDDTTDDSTTDAKTSITNNSILEKPTGKKNKQKVQTIIPRSSVTLQPKIITKTLQQSSITYISDPYLKNYGVYINLTVPYTDMGYYYNALHLYEHLMTRCWTNLDNKEVIDKNGTTYPNGICYVYTIHSTLESMKIYAISSILWNINSRKDDFWDKHKDELNTETERTISETRDQRTLFTHGRSNCTAYRFNYDTKVFNYWSRLPFNILIMGPSPMQELQLNHEKINKEFIKTQSLKPIQPNIETFKYLPLDAIKMQQMFEGIMVWKYDIEQFKSDVMKGYTDKNEKPKDQSTTLSRSTLLEKGFYGYDNIMVSEQSALSSMNTILHPLLFCNKHFTDDELKTLLQNKVLPFDCSRMINVGFNRCNAIDKHGSVWTA